MEKIYQTEIIGCGPAGLGIAVAADRIGQFDTLLRLGIAFVDGGSADRIGCGFFQGLAIRSNSAADDFLVSLSEDGVFRDVRFGVAARIVAAFGTEILDLKLVEALLNDIGQRLRSVLDESAESDLITATTVKAVHRVLKDGENIYRSDLSDGSELFSRNVVLATGAKERKIDLGRNNCKVVLSSEILNSSAIEAVRRKMEENESNEIVVIGASHSAFSAIWKLLENLKDVNFASGAIKVFVRSGVKLFYENVAEARADGYKFDEQEDVCPVTGRVYRYSGIRGDAKALYKAIVDYQEPRVKLCRSTELNDAVLDEAAVIISAVGYEAIDVPLYGPDGSKIGPLLDANGRIDVDDQARVLDFNGGVVPGIFGIGHGHGFKPSKEIGGERSASKHTVDSINIFHGPVGELIVRQIL